MEFLFHEGASEYFASFGVEFAARTGRFVPLTLEDYGFGPDWVSRDTMTAHPGSPLST